MKGFSLLELLLILLLLSVPLFFISPDSVYVERQAIFMLLNEAKFSSVLKHRKVEIYCNKGVFSSSQKIYLKKCRVLCKKIVFRPSGYVVPSGHIILSCGTRKWKFVISTLGRIRVFELGTQ
ncbi:MAG: hypothetical protein J7L62_07620 [Candidatus Aminicenantes bacterium]|nr:hypothetical protein [Candidatus Aminicenantes bacterium]